VDTAGSVNIHEVHMDRNGMRRGAAAPPPMDLSRQGQALESEERPRRVGQGGRQMAFELVVVVVFALGLAAVAMVVLRLALGLA
jgi:hypothetical protein